MTGAAHQKVNAGHLKRNAYLYVHRHQEFLRFLNKINNSAPATGEVHIVMDNYGTHNVAKVRQWFVRHPRYHVHFTPTSASLLNLM
ncbi:MAG TPA: transposase [Bryobacteraceae bacterium]|nr:transposase [Bryobacteraceae bacterium]